jgi:EmrB/QacA subfamily drug resistance transporter
MRSEEHVAIARPYRTLALTSAVAFVSTLDISIVIVAFDDMRRSFEASTAALSWVLTIYTLVAAALLVPSGRLADRIGARQTFLVGIGLFTVGSLLSGIAPNVEILIAARVLQAVGSALQAPASLSLIAEAFTEGRATAVGIWGSVSGLGSALGPSIGALITQNLGWRWVFLINVPLGVAVVVLGVRLLPRTSGKARVEPPDLLGSALIMFGIASLVLALVQGGDWGWGNARTVSAAVFGLLLIIALLVHCARHASPIIDLRLFRIPSFRWANGVGFMFPIGFFVQFFGLVRFFESQWHWTTLQAGLAITPTSAIAAFVTAFAGRIADRYGHRAAMVPGALLYVAGAAWLLWRLGPEPDWWGAWMPAAVLLGLGVGLTYASFNSAAVHALPADRYGSGSAVNLTVNRIGGTFGVAIAVALLGLTPTAATYDRLWIVMIISGTITVGLSALIDTRKYAESGG